MITEYLDSNFTMTFESYLEGCVIDNHDKKR